MKNYSTTAMPAADRARFYRVKMDAEWGPYDLQAAMERMPENILILDTRSPQAYAEEHIPDAINIPTDQLPDRLEELAEGKEIVPYCWSIVCHLATRAALFLSEKGYVVHELAGGIEYWKNYKLPVEGSLQEASR